MRPRYVSYEVSGGRFGNQLFRYLACKLFTVKTGHKYILPTDFLKTIRDDDYVVIDESSLKESFHDLSIQAKHVLCRGYFQKSVYFMSDRSELIREIMTEQNEDRIVDSEGCQTFLVREYLVASKGGYEIHTEDLVVHLRLDDFIQYPCRTSDILPVSYYRDQLRWRPWGRLYIVCDQLHYSWERRYVEYFDQYKNVIFVNETPRTLLQDIALLRDAKRVVHSNSTLVWIVSFLSEKKERVIPLTGMYTGQVLEHIEPTDTVVRVQPLTHFEVENIDKNNDHVFPLSFSVPDEYVVTRIPQKERLLAPLKPGDATTYVFDKTQQDDYYQVYQKSRFAMTKKKGGWDCLRHYEIMMNGCIPLFEDLDNCPDATLTTYPKHLNTEAYRLFHSWQDTEENINDYNALCTKYLEHARRFCTCTASVSYFLSQFHSPIRNILLIPCNCGINYLRESLWIGLKRYVKRVGGVAVEYERLPFLYDDGDNGRHFTLTRCLSSTQDRVEMSHGDILRNIKMKFWDIVVFGKVGRDELMDSYPLYDVVANHYPPEQIAFLYGGDEIHNFFATTPHHSHVNMFRVTIPELPYMEHLNHYKQRGLCFVRELNLPRAFLKDYPSAIRGVESSSENRLKKPFGNIFQQ